MFETLKKNWSITVGVFVLVVLIFGLVFVMSSGDTRNNGGEGEENPFGDTSGERAWATSSDDIFSNPGEAWVPEEQSGKAPRLRAISKNPVAGATVFSRVEAGKVVEYVRYSEYVNGHDYETPLATLAEPEKISNDTRVRIGEVLWNNTGNAVITRYHDENALVVRTHLGYFATDTEDEDAPNPTVTERYEGRDLPGNMVDIAFSPNGADMFYILKTPEGVTGYVESVKTGVAKEVWSSGLQSLSVSWEMQNMILVYTNPSSKAEGAVWSIHPTTGKETVLLAGKVALSPKTSPDGTKVLYSTQESNNGLFQLHILDLSSQKVTMLPVITMAEKCVWGPSDSSYVYCGVPTQDRGGSYLEQWYMGVEESQDALWRINTETGTIKNILDPFKEIQQHFDIVDLRVSPKEEFLIFRSRGNSVLWSLTLSEPKETEGADPQTQ